MLWLFRKLFDRLATKLMLVAAARVDSEMEIELGCCRAELLQAAAELEKQAGGQGEMIAEGLRRRAERLGGDGKGPAAEVVGLVEMLRDENLGEDVRLENRRPIGQQQKQAALPSPTGKKRGRPRKNPRVAAEADEAAS